jgi:hypothetical protein
VFRLGAELLPSARYRWQETGDIPQIPDIVVAGGQCRMEPGGATAADVTFHGDAETFVLLMYQRLPLEVALATGRLVVEGNQALTAAFARWLNGI